jgi:hypothetical protein
MASLPDGPKALPSMDLHQRLRRFMANSACQANVRAAVHGVPMQEVAKHEGDCANLGDSQFAKIRGFQFENYLLKNQAFHLLKALENAGIAGPYPYRFFNLRLKKNGGTFDDVTQVRVAFRKLMHHFALKFRSGKGTCQSALIAGAALMVAGKGVLPHGCLFPDVLLLVPAEHGRSATLSIGEIKVYSDRGGYTDSEELASMRAQAGLYWYAVSQALAHWQVNDTIHLQKQGFFILTHPSRQRLSVRINEDLSWQAQSIRMMLDRLREAAAREEPCTGNLKQLVLQSTTNYQPHCTHFCERARTCHQEAVRKERAQVLGTEVAQLLGNIEISRAIELLQGAVPQSREEHDLVHHLNVPPPISKGTERESA